MRIGDAKVVEPAGIKSEYDLKKVQELINERNALLDTLGKVINTTFGDDAIYISSSPNTGYGVSYSIPSFIVRWITNGLEARIDVIKGQLQHQYGLPQ